MGEDAQGEDEISEPEEDNLAGQMATMRGEPVKKRQTESDEDDDSDTDGDEEADDSSDQLTLCCAFLRTTPHIRPPIYQYNYRISTTVRTISLLEILPNYYFPCAVRIQFAGNLLFSEFSLNRSATSQICGADPGLTEPKFEKLKAIS